MVGFAVFGLVSGRLERRFLATGNSSPSGIRVVLQWLPTGFLWSQWLMVVRDASRAFAGLAVSVILAFGLPVVHARLRPDRSPSIKEAQQLAPLSERNRPLATPPPAATVQSEAPPKQIRLALAD